MRSAATVRPGGRRTAVLLALVVALTSACSTQVADTTDTEVVTIDTVDAGTKKVEITWWHGQTSDAATLLRSLADEYQTDHPNVTIKAASGAPTTDDLLAKLQAGFASDTAPDISYTYGSWVTELGVSGRTLDITERVKDANSGWDEFPEAARATATVEGKVVGMPAVLGNLALYYNTELFNAANLDYPTADWTWEDFRAAAKAINNPDKNIYGTAYPVAGNEDTTWRFWPQLWQNGGAVLDDEGMPAFNSQAGADTLEFWRALAQDDKSVYLDQNGEKYSPAFQAGRIGMIISGPWLLYDFKQAKTPYGVQILPGTNGDHQTVAGVDLWTLFDHGDEARAAVAYDFARWLTAPEQDVRWNVAYGNLPLRFSAKDTPEFAAFVTEFPGAQTFFDNLANAVNPRPTVVGYAAMSTEFAKAVAQVLVADADPATELDKAAEAAALELEQG